MKYYIRTQDDRELTVQTGSQLVVLFRQQFLAPDDEVRREGSQRWRKLRDIPEYASMIRAQRQDRLQFKWILYAVTLFVFGGLLYGMLIG